MKKFVFADIWRRQRKIFPRGMWGVILAGVLAIFLVDCYLILLQEHQYQEKIDILAVMLQGQQEGRDSLSMAVELLKGVEKSAGEAGREQLKSYGYLKDQINWFQLEKTGANQNIILLSFLVFGVYLCSIYWVHRKWRIKHKRQLKGLSQVLNQFSKHIYETDFVERLDDRETEIEHIAVQLSELSEQLRFHEKYLRQEKEQTRSFVTDISHQLKTPIAGIKTCVEILNQEDLNEQEQREFLAQCNRQICGLENLVGALVNISRMETGMIEIVPKPADLLETLVAAVNRVYLKAEAKQITVEFEESKDLDSVVICHDVKWVCEAFINILENAVKYSPKDSKLYIRMIRRTTFVRIEFEDFGIGIPKKDYHKIFQRFFRGEAKEVQKTEGTGVGLYLTREILKRHGGSVTVTSKSGNACKGSIFVVQLPYQVYPKNRMESLS